MYLLYIMKRRLSEEERRLHRHNTVVKYRRTDKGRMATRKAALRYYHKNKGKATGEIENLLKKKYPKVECFEVTIFETKEKAGKNESI